VFLAKAHECARALNAEPSLIAAGLVNRSRNE
jgi:hypothetical protein